MIRQCLSSIALCALLVVASLGAGCVSVQTASGGRVTYWVVPGLEGSESSNRAGTSYYNQRWGRSPDSHPAVAGRVSDLSQVAGPSAAPRAPDGGDAVENGSGSASSAYPPYSTRTSQEQRVEGQRTGAVIGALIGTQAGHRLTGVGAGAAIGALAGGKIADPCQPDLNAGSFWGALAGGWLGSLFGGGRGREFFTALGAAGGALRGTEQESSGRGCR